MLKHQKRNRITSILVVMSFFVLIFFLSFINITFGQLDAKNRLVAGSDVRVSSNSLFDPCLTSDLLTIDGVSGTTGMIRGLGGITSYLGGEELSISCIDTGGAMNQIINIAGIDSNYYNTMFSDCIMLDEGDAAVVFHEIQDAALLKVVISFDLSRDMHLHVGDLMSLRLTRGGVSKSLAATVIGVYHFLPGLYANPDLMAGYNPNTVIFSIHQLRLAFDLGVDAGPSSIYCKVLDGTNLNTMRDRIQSAAGTVPGLRVDVYKTLNYSAVELYSYVRTIVVVLFALFLSLTVSGLLNAAYSSFLERKNEIRLFKMLGLSFEKIRSLFLLEVLLLLIMNGILGTVVALIVTAGVSNLTTHVIHAGPNLTPAFPEIGLIFGVCICVAWALVWKIFKRDDLATILD